jgi:hypothetical protein
MQKSNLFAVTTTPSAAEQMQPEAKPFCPRQGTAQHFALRARGLAAIEAECGAGRFHLVPEIHFLNANEQVVAIVSRSTQVDLTSLRE